MTENQPQQDPKLRFASAGIEFAVVMLALTAAGYGVGQWLDEPSLGLLCGLTLGFAASLWRLLRQVRPDREDRSDESGND